MAQTQITAIEQCSRCGEPSTWYIPAEDLHLCDTHHHERLLAQWAVYLQDMGQAQKQEPEK